MITEDYVSFEIAKLLKEKGFDVYGDGSLDSGIEIHKEYSPNGSLNSCAMSKPHFKAYPAPTLQMAMKWLREEKNIFIVIEPYAYDYVNEKNESYSCSLWIGDNYYEFLESRDYPSYEEAVEAAIKYCLEKLNLI